MNQSLLYFDFNSTTPLDPRCLEAMLPFFHFDFGNSANQSHALGHSAGMAIQNATAEVAKLLNCRSHELIWNSGATEGNNSVLQFFANRTDPTLPKPHFIVSSIEHPSVLQTALDLLERQQIELTLLEVDRLGFISIESLKKAFRQNTKLVSIMWVNNEIGTIQNIEQISQICSDQGVHFHTDATQGVGKVQMDLSKLPISYLTASSHKFYGPKGVGFLYVKSQQPNAPIPKILSGGSHQRGNRPGTMNTPGIVATGKACEILFSEMHIENEKMQFLTKIFWERLQSEFPSVILNGPELGTHQRSPMNINFTLPNRSIDLVAGKLTGLAFSQGSACHSGIASMSATLKAIGLTERAAGATLRMSVGRQTTIAEIELAISILKRAFAS